MFHLKNLARKGLISYTKRVETPLLFDLNRSWFISLNVSDISVGFILNPAILFLFSRSQTC